MSAGFGIRQYDWVTPRPEDTTKVALIQGNVDQNLKWLPSQRWPTIMKYADLTRENWDATSLSGQKQQSLHLRLKCLPS